MGQALYRKYRSRALSEIVGQDHITRTLDRAIEQGRISHAYLFTGPRGVGKTSIARILAHAVNELEYSDDTPHIDIIEIDAASNRRIDEIRDLRDKVAIAPVSARYKVYIIDEVHMLTREAFNALLKTLEEPPAHVIFILATTDAHKLPETIISRTQRFSFRPVPKEQVITHLKEIADKEKIDVSQEALELLAAHGEGSFRDSISLLDQASSHAGKIGVSDIQEILGIPSDETLEGLLADLKTSVGSAQLMQRLMELYDRGYQPATIAKTLAKALREQLIAGEADQNLLQLLEDLLEVPVAHEPDRYLEIALLRALKPVPESKASLRTETPVRTPKEEPVAPKKSVPPAKPKASETEKSTKKVAEPSILAPAIWPEVLQALKQHYNTLYGVVRMAEPEFDGNTLRLRFAFAFHQKRLSEKSNSQILATTIKDLTGQVVTIECIFDETAKPPKLTADNQIKTDPTDLKTISNIFGGGELLES
jgi:DNA polymerase-3 subunit gamma/tau